MPNSKNGNRAGRQTNLTQAIIEAADRELQEGCFEKHVAAALGIPISTWDRWKQQGEHMRSGLENGEWDSVESMPRNAKLYLAFREVCDRGRAVAINTSVKEVRRIGKDGNWTALKWWLQVRDPETFGEQGTLTHELRGQLGLTVSKEDRQRIHGELDETFLED